MAEVVKKQFKSKYHILNMDCGFIPNIYGNGRIWLCNRR